MHRVPAGSACLRCSSRRRYTLPRVGTAGPIAVRKVVTAPSVVARHRVLAGEASIGAVRRRVGAGRVERPYSAAAGLAAVDLVAAALVVVKDRAGGRRTAAAKPAAVAVDASRTSRQ